MLLDEMHSSTVARSLSESGWDVVSVAAEPMLRGMSDAELLEHCRSDRHALITENVGDFSALAAVWAAEDKQHHGLAFTNPKRFNRASLAYPGNLIAALGEFLANPPVEGHSWVWWLQ